MTTVFTKNVDLFQQQSFLSHLEINHVIHNPIANNWHICRAPGLQPAAFFALSNVHIISNICLITYNSSPFSIQITAFHFTYKNWPCFQNIQFGIEEHRINMLCKILAFFILPCLVISFKMDIKPAVEGNLSLFKCTQFPLYAVITE